MSKVTNTSVEDNVVVITTEGYLNKDLGEAIQEIAQEHISSGNKIFLINLTHLIL